MQYELLNHHVFLVLSTLFHSEVTYKGTTLIYIDEILYLLIHAFAICCNICP